METTIAYWSNDFKQKIAEKEMVQHGVEAVISSWKLQITSTFMSEEGSIQLESLRAAIDARLPTGRPQSTLSKARIAEIRAVIKMQGTLTDDDIKKMVAKLNITKEEYDDVVAMMDTMDED
jgi:hypothetical protein